MIEQKNIMGNTTKQMQAEGKLFYKIGDVTRMTEIQSFVIRFWESEFPSLAPKRNAGKQRVYTKKDIELILKIKNLLYKEGLTISGARARLEGQVSLQAFPQHTLGWVKHELEEVLTLLS